HCATMMAALGAEVIKVESLMRVDAARIKQVAKDGKASTMVVDPNRLEHGYAFHAINTGKLGVRANFKSRCHPGGVLAEGSGAAGSSPPLPTYVGRGTPAKPRGSEAFPSCYHDLVRSLVQTADVVIEAFTPGVIERLGLGYETRRRWRPELVMLSLAGFGRGGPESGYRAYAPVFAASGLCHVSGYRDGPPMEFIGSIDSTAGTHALMAVMAALAQRDRTGVGQHIDLSGAECVTALLGGPVIEYAATGKAPQRDGNRRPGFAPNNCYRCRGDEEWISIAIATDDEWQALASVIDRSSLSLSSSDGEGPLAKPGRVRSGRVRRDRRFATLAARKKNEASLDALIEAWTRTVAVYDAMRLLQTAGVAAVPSFRSDQLFTDPHIAGREGWVRLVHPVQGIRHELRAPWRFANAGAVYRPAPLMGQHEPYIYGDLLGIPEATLDRLRQSRVVY
ncbi:MAG: CoA transferase, partial [Chloroflexi bacterium]|nr:CoA transferase [Chloroflexota bacterium]